MSDKEACEDESLFSYEDIVEVIELNNDDFADDEYEEEEDDEDYHENEHNNETETETQATADTNFTDAETTVVFSGHKETVFCVRIDPLTSNYAVTGGQDDKAFVWDVKTGETVFECTDHAESVTAVGFSQDGKYVATGDLGGLLQVWDMATREQIWKFECSDIEWLLWLPTEPVLLAGTADGDTWVWTLSTKDTKILYGQGTGSVCGAICPDGKRACIGYKDGIIKVWNLETGSCLHTFTGRDAHTSSVVSLDCCHDNTLAVSGSADNTAKLFNTATGKVLATFSCKSRSDPSKIESVETVGFSKVMPWVATGNLAGVLEIWDVSSQTVRQKCHHEEGIVKLKWHSDSPLIFTASLDGCMRQWDARNGSNLFTLQCHPLEILDFDISSRGNFIATVSEDSKAKIFPIPTLDR